MTRPRRSCGWIADGVVAVARAAGGFPCETIPLGVSCRKPMAASSSPRSAAAAVGHSLSSYLPRTLVDRVVGGGALSEPEVHSGEAAVLLSDIQGFTSLVESYAARGRLGLEEI